MTASPSQVLVSGSGMKDICYIPINDLQTIGCPYCFAPVNPSMLSRGITKIMVGCLKCNRAYIALAFDEEKPEISLNGEVPHVYEASASYFALAKMFREVRQKSLAQENILNRLMQYGNELMGSSAWHFIQNRTAGKIILQLLNNEAK